MRIVNVDWNWGDDEVYFRLKRDDGAIGEIQLSMVHLIAGDWYGQHSVGGLKMSEEKYEGRYWSEDLETYKVDGEWEHRFTVDGMEVKMGSPNGGHFGWSHKTLGFHLSGDVWYGDERGSPAMWSSPSGGSMSMRRR